MRTHALWPSLLMIVPATYSAAMDNPGPAGQERSFPPRLLSGYTGYGLERNSIQDTIDNYLDPMYRALKRRFQARSRPSQLIRGARHS